jgi:signal transduction histidine kinase
MSVKNIASADAIKMANLSIGMGLLYMFIATPVLFLVLHNYLLAWQHVGVTLCCFLLLAHVNITKTVALTERSMAYLAAITIVFIVFTLGSYNVGTYLMMPVYIFIFFLTNRRRGSRIIFLIFLAFLAGYILDWLDIVKLPYDRFNFGVFLFSYILAFVFFVLYARQKEVLDTKLRASSRENERLVERLKIEKAGVEQKVDERTHELSKTQAELMASISSLPFGFALINDQGEVAFTNHRLGPLLGFATHLTVADIHTALAPDVRLTALIRHTQTKRQAVERQVEHGGRFLRLLLTPIIDQEDQLIGTVFVIEDTTEQRSIERSRDEFFSIASHELRTPLTAIRGNTDMIMQYYKKELKNPEIAEMVNDIHSASVRLIKIVNDFLDTSRLEMGKIDFKASAFDARDLITEILREYDVTGSRKHLDLAFAPTEGPLPMVYADRDRTRQVLINLVGNALKMTEQGEVHLQLEAKDKIMKISVTDTGKGIAESSRHLLFRKFQQASDNILTRDRTDSTGLGLYISKLLAEGMNGKLYLAHTEVGKGSTFVLELPLWAHSNS